MDIEIVKKSLKLFHGPYDGYMGVEAELRRVLLCSKEKPKGDRPIYGAEYEYFTTDNEIHCYIFKGNYLPVNNRQFLFVG